MELKNSTVLITGGATRVGAFLAEYFHGAGARVIVHYHTSSAAAVELQKRIGCALLQADLADSSSMELFRAFPLDILVNNASLYLPHQAGKLVEDRHFAINSEAPERLSRLAASVNPRGGCIIQMLDQAVLCPPAPTDSSYLRSKRDLYRKIPLLAEELAPAWRVNAIAPGPVLPPTFLPESRMKLEISKTLLKHQVHLADIARAADFLVRCDSITGAVLPVDCGRRFFAQT